MFCLPIFNKKGLTVFFNNCIDDYNNNFYKKETEFLFIDHFIDDNIKHHDRTVKKKKASSSPPSTSASSLLISSIDSSNSSMTTTASSQMTTITETLTTTTKNPPPEVLKLPLARSIDSSICRTNNNDDNNHIVGGSSTNIDGNCKIRTIIHNTDDNNKNNCTKSTPSNRKRTITGASDSVSTKPKTKKLTPLISAAVAFAASILILSSYSSTNIRTVTNDTKNNENAALRMVDIHYKNISSLLFVKTYSPIFHLEEERNNDYNQIKTRNHYSTTLVASLQYQEEQATKNDDYHWTFTQEVQKQEDKYREKQVENTENTTAGNDDGLVSIQKDMILYKGIEEESSPIGVILEKEEEMINDIIDNQQKSVKGILRLKDTAATATIALESNLDHKLSSSNMAGRSDIQKDIDKIMNQNNIKNKRIPIRCQLTFLCGRKHCQ